MIPDVYSPDPSISRMVTRWRAALLQVRALQQGGIRRRARIPVSIRPQIEQDAMALARANYVPYGREPDYPAQGRAWSAALENLRLAVEDSPAEDTLCARTADKIIALHARTWVMAREAAQRYLAIDEDALLAPYHALPEWR